MGGAIARVCSSTHPSPWAAMLAISFKSVLVPIKAAAMNLLSVAAAYGVWVEKNMYGKARITYAPARKPQGLA